MEDKQVFIKLNKNELNHLINDTIHYIYHIKSIVFGDAWSFGTDITEVKELNEQQKQELEMFGYYSRIDLLNKLKEIENINFPDAYRSE